MNKLIQLEKYATALRKWKLHKPKMGKPPIKKPEPIQFELSNDDKWAIKIEKQILTVKIPTRKRI